jgi:predicted CXXCH cytochrome family protein
MPAGPHVDHGWIETVNVQGNVVARGRLDEALTGALRFTVYRVRFQVVNDGDSDATLKPRLQVSDDAATWSSVPEVDPVVGVPFYAASDDGKVFKARREAIAAKDLRLASSDDPLAVPVDGQGSAGRDVLAALALPAHSFTEVEFAVRATNDAAWQTSYEFRMVDGDLVLSGPMPPTITMGAKPALHLSPGQKDGRPVAAPVPRYGLLPSGTDSSSGGPLIPATTVGLRFPLAANGTAFVSPHVIEGLTADTCAACHAAHSAQDSLITQDPSPTGLCFRCHDGSGSTFDVQAQFTSPSVPANDPSTDAWYSHPATEPAPVTADPGFEGVLNRRAQCVDCHQPHLADGTRPVGTDAGWTAAGAIQGAPGVSVANGAAGTAPTYSLNQTSTFEYELCLKCHSGYTVLPAQDPDHPSRWELDKGIELNPANVSYHPVEAAGRNQTNAMALSLSGSSPYKLWALDTTSTIRCQSCHGDSDKANPASPPAADARLDNHAGPNRGLLIEAYRDRDLLSSNELYQAADFALCYVCHAEAPMVDDSGDVRYDTNFNWHGFHLNALIYNGTGGRDIDIAGDGQGNATCSECHFRPHGTALAFGGQPPATGLVNFAPDVLPYNGVLKFVPATSTTLGSCTLSCHGKPHDGYVYAAAP